MNNTEDLHILLSSISHEIRNPLTLINSYLQLIARSHPDVAADPCWTVVQSEMSHLKLLLTDISAYQNTRLHLCPVDMGKWLREYATVTAPMLLQDTSIVFRAEIAPRLPLVNADADKLRQVLDNLIRNAREAIAAVPTFVSAAARPSGASTAPAADADCAPAAYFVCLQAKTCSGFLHITVSDNGCGILDTDLPTLFKPFVTHKNGGTGLGLAISRRIIEAHGGTLNCSSCAAPTRFEVLLPAESPR